AVVCEDAAECDKRASDSKRDAIGAIRMPGYQPAADRRGLAMAKQHPHPSNTSAERASDYSDQGDREVMQALVTAGALVALADGRVDAVERDELVNFIHRQRLVPAISQHEIAEAFDNRVRQLEHRDSVEMIVQAFRPLAGRSLASIVVRSAERVAAADRQIHRGELNALKLIRLLLMTLPAQRSVLASHAGNPAKRET